MNILLSYFKVFKITNCQKLRQFGKLILISLFSFSIYSCHSSDNEKDEIKKEIAKIKLSVSHEQINPRTNNDIVPPVPVQYQFESPTAHQSAKNLANPSALFPINKFQFTGAILEGLQTTAYVKDPSGHLYAIKVGDRIGAEQALVVLIAADKIKLKIGNQFFEIKKG